MITHIVFFKLADQSPQSISSMKDLLLSMWGRIPQLRSLEVGVDIVRSERSYDLALVTRFDSLEDLQSYQVHPYHADEVIPYVKGAAASIVAVDFESE